MAITKLAGYLNIPPGKLTYDQAVAVINRLPYETYIKGYPGGSDLTTDELREAVAKDLEEKDFTPLRGVIGGGIFGGGIGAITGALIRGRKGALIGAGLGGGALGALGAIENATHIRNRREMEELLSKTEDDPNALDQVSEHVKMPLKDRGVRSFSQRPEWEETPRDYSGNVQAVLTALLGGAGGTAGYGVGQITAKKDVALLKQLLEGLKGGKRLPKAGIFALGNVGKAVSKRRGTLGALAGFGVGAYAAKKVSDKVKPTKTAGLNMIKAAFDPTLYVDSDLVPYMSREEMVYNMLTGAQGRAMDDPPGYGKAMGVGGGVGGGLGALIGASKGMAATSMSRMPGINRRAGGIWGAGIGAVGGAGLGALMNKLINKNISGAKEFMDEDANDPRKLNELVYALKARAAHEQDARRKPEVNIVNNPVV